MNTALAYAPYWKNGLPAYIVVPIVVGVVVGVVTGVRSTLDKNRKDRESKDDEPNH